MASCMAAIGLAGWYSLTVKDEKQILADKSECEQKAMTIIESKKTEFPAQESTKNTISIVDQIFQQEFTACMKAKDYYKVAAKPKP
jgi:hypothetical protein